MNEQLNRIFMWNIPTQFYSHTRYDTYLYELYVDGADNKSLAHALHHCQLGSWQPSNLSSVGAKLLNGNAATADFRS